MAYQCGVCKLKYSDKKLADKCEEWCSTHNSCNFLIARQAVNKEEMKKNPEKDSRFPGA